MRSAISRTVVILVIVVALGLVAGGVFLGASPGTSNSTSSASTTTSTPILTASVSSSSTTLDKTQTQTSGGLVVTISYANSPATRGSYQTISVDVTDSKGTVSNANVSVIVQSASGQTTKNLWCVTSNGYCEIVFPIGGTWTIGTSQVIVTVEGVVFNSSFEVISVSGS